MKKIPKQVPEELKKLVKDAKYLREWSRFSSFSRVNSEAMRSDRRDMTYSKKAFEARRMHYVDALSTIKEQHEQLDKFFAKLGFPAVSKNHPIAREWDRAIGHLRVSASRDFYKDAKDRPKNKKQNK